MKRKPTAVLLSLCLALCALFSGCNVNVNVKDVSSIESRARQVISRLAENDEESDSAAEESSETSSKTSSKASSKKSSKAGSKTSSKTSSKVSSKASSKTSSKVSSKASSKASSKTSSKASSKAASYTMADVKALKNTEHFAKKTLEHIFDGTINSKGEIIAGTESARDSRGVFTAKVKVSGVKKNGFSSFYPEDWSPQQVVDAINEAYQDALSDKSNPHGELWIGYSGDLEIDMYLDSGKKITTAYPIYEGD